MKLKVRPQPLQVLNLLLSRAGDLVTREELRNQLWSTDTFVDFEHSLNTSVRELRAVLDDSAAEPRYIETLPRLGYRFIAAVTREETQAEATNGGAAESDGSLISPVERQSELRQKLKRRTPWLQATGLGLVILVLAGNAALIFQRQHKSSASEKPEAPAAAPVERDLIVLTDFENKTGDPVFDDTLKQALSMELTQSPNLNVASNLQVEEALRRMNRAPNGAVTRELAAEVCSRLEGKAVIAGTIAKMERNYVIELEALGCANGGTLGFAQGEAQNKDSVIKAMDLAASQIRGKIGESMPNLQRYNFPVNATTDSLQALKAFTTGLKAEKNEHPVEAIPFYKEAIRLDPNFALAFAVLGRAYEDTGEDEKAMENYKRAYKLRDRLSERERYFVTTLYEETVTGDLWKAREAGELWVDNYPRDGFAREKLGTVYADLGETEKYHYQFQEALHLDPNSEVNLFNAVFGFLSVNQVAEAGQLLRSAQSRGHDGMAVRLASYLVAFRQLDAAAMERQVAWGKGKPGVEATLLSTHSQTQAFFGRIGEARALTARAIASAQKAGARETAANCALVSALREIEIGNPAASGPSLRIALSLAPTRNVMAQSALALARSGKVGPARKLAHELKHDYPGNTLVQSYWVPSTEASIELQNGNAQAALADLEVAAPYDFSEAPPVGDELFMYPIYIRGEAYLAAGNGAAAEAEFKKVLDHPGLAMNCILYPLSRLQRARALAMLGDKTAATRQYEAFLAGWKDGNADIPVLKQARAEIEKLRASGKNADD